MNDIKKEDNIDNKLNNETEINNQSKENNINSINNNESPEINIQKEENINKEDKDSIKSEENEEKKDEIKSNNINNKINLENVQIEIDKYTTDKRSFNKYAESKNNNYINKNKLSKENNGNIHSEQENKFDIGNSSSDKNAFNDNKNNFNQNKIYMYNNNNMNYNNLYNNQGNLYNIGAYTYGYSAPNLYIIPANNQMVSYYYNNNHRNYEQNNNDYYQENNSYNNKEKEENKIPKLNSIPLLQTAKPYYPKNMRKNDEKDKNEENKENESNKKDDNKENKDTIEQNSDSKENKEENVLEKKEEEKKEELNNNQDKKDNIEENKKIEDINNEKEKNNEEKIEEEIPKEKKEEKLEEKKEKDDSDNWADISVSSEDEEIIEEKNSNNNNKIKETDNKPSEKIDKEEIQQLLNEVSSNVYHEPKNKLKLLLNNNILNQDFFIDTIYQLSLEQLTFQQMYSNLFKDIYHYLSSNKNELKNFRKKLILKCKENLMNKKICKENQKIINNNITLIGELINVKIFPKKMGLKCLNYLLNKYYKYSTKNNKQVEYIYLECVIILLNVICSFIYNYQQYRIHAEFNEEIIKIVNKLKEIAKDEKKDDIPNYTRHLLSTVIDKADKKWELASYEKKKFASHLEILNKEPNDFPIDEENNKSFNDSSFIKEEEYDKSFNEEEIKDDIDENIISTEKKITVDGIELEEDKKAYNNNYKNDFGYKGKYRYGNSYNEDYSKSSSTLSYNKKKSEFYQNSNSNSNIINLNNNFNHKYNYNKNASNYYKINSNSNLYSSKYSKGSNYDNNSISNNETYTSGNNNYNNQKIVSNNLRQFRYHIDNKKNINSFNWKDIDNLVIQSKIGMNDFIEILIDSCYNFNIKSKSIYYIDLYLKTIFEYYKKYFDKNDFSDIKDAIVKNLEKLYNEQNNNSYLEDVWIILIYYLIINQIFPMSNFNSFNRESYSIKKYIADIISKIINYNREAKKHLIIELKSTKFFYDNRNIFDYIK